MTGHERVIREADDVEGIALDMALYGDAFIRAPRAALETGADQCRSLADHQIS